MKSKKVPVKINDRRFRLPKVNLDVYLYEYGVTITDGTIIGIRAVTSIGTDSTAEQGNNPGNYFFNNIPTGKKYSVVVSGSSVTTQIPEELEEIDIGMAYDVTGSDIPYKNNSTVSIATRLGELGDYTTQYEQNPSSDSTISFETDKNLLIVDTSTALDDITIVFPDDVDKIGVSFVSEDVTNKTFISEYDIIGDSTSTKLNFIFLEDESRWFSFQNMKKVLEIKSILEKLSEEKLIYRGVDEQGFKEIKVTEGGTFGDGIYFYDNPLPARSHATYPNGGVIVCKVNLEDISVNKGGVIVVKDVSKIKEIGKISLDETIDKNEYLEEIEKIIINK